MAKNLKVKSFGVTMCLDMATESIMIHEGQIDQPGHPLHDRQITKKVITQKVKGKFVTLKNQYYLTGDNKMFNSLIEFAEYYKLILQ